MKANITVLAASAVDMTDQKSGERIEGTTIHYLMEGAGESTATSKGSSPAKGFIRGGAAWSLIQAVPGLYEAEMAVSQKSSGGRSYTDLKVTAVKFLAPVTIAAAKPAG